MRTPRASTLRTSPSRTLLSSRLLYVLFLPISLVLDVQTSYPSPSSTCVVSRKPAAAHTAPTVVSTPTRATLATLRSSSAPAKSRLSGQRTRTPLLPLRSLASTGDRSPGGASRPLALKHLTGGLSEGWFGGMGGSRRFDSMPSLSESAFIISVCLCHALKTSLDLGGSYALSLSGFAYFIDPPFCLPDFEGSSG